MDLKVNIYKDGQHWKTKKFEDPRTKFVRDFNAVNGQNSAVVARENIERVQKSLWLSRYVVIPVVIAATFLAALTGVGAYLATQMEVTVRGGSFFATTPDFDDPRIGETVPIARWHCTRDGVSVTKDNTMILQQSEFPYILSWAGGFDQDDNPDQVVQIGFRCVNEAGLRVDPILSNDAEARYKTSSYEYQRGSAKAIFDASEGPLMVRLEILWGSKDLDLTEGWIEISQSQRGWSGLSPVEPGGDNDELVAPAHDGTGDGEYRVEPPNLGVGSN